LANIAMRRATGDEHMAFINAWNEWAKGNHLEQDLKWGTAYLEATLRALQDPVAMPAQAATESVNNPKAPSFTTKMYWKAMTSIKSQWEALRQVHGRIDGRGSHHRFPSFKRPLKPGRQYSALQGWHGMEVKEQDQRKTTAPRALPAECACSPGRLSPASGGGVAGARGLGVPRCAGAIWRSLRAEEFIRRIGGNWRIGISLPLRSMHDS
jgi:hypothetical protein